MKIVNFTELHTYPPGTIIRGLQYAETHLPLGQRPRPTFGPMWMLEEAGARKPTGPSLIYYTNIGTPLVLHDHVILDCDGLMEHIHVPPGHNFRYLKPAAEQEPVRMWHHTGQCLEIDDATSMAIYFAVFDLDDINIEIDRLTAARTILTNSLNKLDSKEPPACE